MEKKYYTYMYRDPLHGDEIKCIDDVGIFDCYEDVRLEAEKFCESGYADVVLIVEVKPYECLEEVTILKAKEMTEFQGVQKHSFYFLSIVSKRKHKKIINEFLHRFHYTTCGLWCQMKNDFSSQNLHIKSIIFI